MPAKPCLVTLPITVSSRHTLGPTEEAPGPHGTLVLANRGSTRPIRDTGLADGASPLVARNGCTKGSPTRLAHQWWGSCLPTMLTAGSQMGPTSGNSKPTTIV